jgi:hypothetical protein
MRKVSKRLWTTFCGRRGNQRQSFELRASSFPATARPHNHFNCVLRSSILDFQKSQTLNVSHFVELYIRVSNKANTAIMSFNGPLNEPWPTAVDTEQSTISYQQKGFMISARKLPISKSGPIDEMSKRLGIPVPEMIFGDNMVGQSGTFRDSFHCLITHETMSQVQSTSQRETANSLSSRFLLSIWQAVGGWSSMRMMHWIGWTRRIKIC